MSNVFNFHGNVNMNVYCKKCTITEEPDSGCGLEINSITVDFNTGFIFELTNTSGTHVGAVITINDGDVELDCQETTSQYIIPLEAAQVLFGGQTLTFTSYSDDCQTSTCEVIIPISFNQLEIPITGENTIFELNGEPVCTEDSSYSVVLAGPNSIVMNNTNGNLTIPAQEIEGNGPGGVYIYYYICGGEVVYFVIVFMANPQGPQQMYSCDGNTCIEDNNGQYDHSSCYGNCNGGGGGTMYSCVNNECIEDENGIYNNNNCDNNCPLYSCNGLDCIEDENGTYSNSNCNDECVLLYDCDGFNCIETVGGQYETSNCDFACEEPVLLGFIEFEDIADSPVPGNSAVDWIAYENSFTLICNCPDEPSVNYSSTVVSGNILYFYGIPQLNEKFVLNDVSIINCDFSGFTYLTHFSSYYCGLSNFDPTQLPALVNINVAAIDSLSLNFSMCPNVEKIILQVCSVLESINTDNCVNLKLMSIGYCFLLNTVDVTDNIALEELYLIASAIPTIDVDNNINLTILSVGGGGLLTSINVDNNILLTSLSLGGNSLSTIDISNNVNLVQLSLGSNLLTAVDFSNNINLVTLDISSNPITALDLSLNILLTTLSLNYCTSLVTYTLPSSLLSLSIVQMGIISFDISNLINLQNLSAYYNNLTNIDITNSSSWLSLYLVSNDISLDTNINNILAHLVSINFTGYVTLNDGTNAAPTGQGILDVATLIGNGASVTTN